MTSQMLGGSNSDKKDAAGSIRQKCLYTPNIFFEKYKGAWGDIEV